MVTECKGGTEDLLPFEASLASKPLMTVWAMRYQHRPEAR